VLASAHAGSINRRMLIMLKPESCIGRCLTMLHTLEVQMYNIGRRFYLSNILLLSYNLILGKLIDPRRTDEQVLPPDQPATN
jgi:hypothetical protein